MKFIILTGQKLHISILAKQGHSVTYDTVCEIETSQAELTRVFQKEGASMPLQPKEDSSTFPTFFWWDNFDQNIERYCDTDLELEDIDL